MARHLRAQMTSLRAAELAWPVVGGRCGSPAAADGRAWQAARQPWTATAGHGRPTGPAEGRGVTTLRHPCRRRRGGRAAELLRRASDAARPARARLAPGRPSRGRRTGREQNRVRERQNGQPRPRWARGGRKAPAGGPIILVPIIQCVTLTHQRMRALAARKKTPTVARRAIAIKQCTTRCYSSSPGRGPRTGRSPPTESNYGRIGRFFVAYDLRVPKLLT